jgi:hypothetical protein
MKLFFRTRADDGFVRIAGLQWGKTNLAQSPPFDQPCDLLNTQKNTVTVMVTNR